MKIIDAHAHIYPTKIADKATKTIGEFYDINMHIKSGTIDNLLEEGLRAGVSKFIVHSCATKPQQVRPINQFIKQELDNHNEFIGFMTLHQDLSEEEIYNEVTWATQNGFKGIKLHPDFQKFNIDAPEYEKIYRAIDNRLPILFHTGDNRYDFSKPFRLANIAKKFPKTNFIGAHFGGYRCWDEVEVYKGLENVYFDTSSSLSFISIDKALQIINLLGVEKFFFGTDFPMWTAEEEIKKIYNLKLSDKQNQMVFNGNVSALLNL